MDLEKNNLLQNKISKSKEFNFAQKKENTISSLFEVEQFLCNFKNICKCIKLFKIFR